jgi:ATP-dependent DNA helicase DinG
VVATATKALQDQLAGKDLPFLAEHLGGPFEFAVLKGRSNYVCRQRLELRATATEQLGSTARRAGARAELAAAGWAATTTTGDRAELDRRALRRVAWAAVSVGPASARAPTGARAASRASPRRPAARAEADVVVVNTHLYGLDLATGGVVLPEHDVVVIDEAHQLEDIVSATSRARAHGGPLLRLARKLVGGDPRRRPARRRGRRAGAA